MGSNSAELDATIQEKWEETLAANHEPGKTISANLEITKRIVKSSLADGIRRLGYEFGAELGRGGLGLVNLATQQVFDRSVAVKRLLGGSTDREAAMKFFAEALITAQLEHPNIVPIHDLMADTNGQLQLVMKRVEGFSWRDLLYPRSDEHRARVERLTLDDHLDILLKVCDAVSFAHGRSILHRDLKPENVMVGAYGEVLVMDWGCAVGFGNAEHHPVVPRVDEITHIAGTPSYMAPEMVLVQAERIGPHSDVYQLGAVLYEVLTRQKAHRGGNVYEVLRDAAKGRVVPPVEAAPDRGIPDELSDICLAALAKNADERIRDVDGLAQRLKDYRRHAQAVALITSARAQLTIADKRPAAAADALRKAVSASEQAREIWPEWPVAAQMLLHSTMAYARHHLDAGAATLAAAQAKQAETLARELGRIDLTKTAHDLEIQARAAAAAQAARQRQLHLARVGMAAAGVVVVIGLAVFLMLVSNEQRRTAAALAKAESALAALSTEKTGRSGDQKTSAPALVVQARKAIAVKDWDAAITALRTAISFDSKLVEAHQLLVNVLAAAKRYGEVPTAGSQWQDAAGGDALATRMIALCRVLDSKPSEVVATETQLQLADLFERQQLYILAETTAIKPAKRLELYRKRINEAWPGVGNGVVMRKDGKLEADSFKNHAEIIDLEPIRGMPFARLSLYMSGVRNLNALSGMPLEELDLENTANTDLSPLRGAQLRRLRINNTKITDLSPLADMPLEFLWGYNGPLSNISPLKGMPLKDVNLGGCQIADLGPLAGAPITQLSIGNLVRDLSPLRGMPLYDCSIIATGDVDLSPLSGAPLNRLSIDTRGSVDVANLPTSITNLELWGPGLGNPAALARFKLKALHIEVYNGDRTVDLRHIDGSRLEILNIGHCDKLDLLTLSAPQLKRLSCGYNGDIDLSPLASCPLTEIDLGTTSQVTWRSLSAFRQSTTLTTMIINNKRQSAASFWEQYRPDLFGSAVQTSGQVTVIAEPLTAIRPPATAPGLAWSAMDGIHTSVAEILQAQVVATGVTDVIALKQPFPDFRGLRYTGYLTVPKDGEYTFTVTSDDGSRLQLGKHMVVDNDHLQAPTAVSGRIRLTAGAHPLTLLYFNGEKTSALEVTISGPDLKEQPLPPTWLSH